MTWWDLLNVLDTTNQGRYSNIIQWDLLNVLDTTNQGRYSNII